MSSPRLAYASVAKRVAAPTTTLIVSPYRTVWRKIMFRIRLHKIVRRNWEICILAKMQWAARYEHGATRDVGRPHRRWDDSMADVTQHKCGTNNWRAVAMDASLWDSLEKDFVNE